MSHHEPTQSNLPSHSTTNSYATVSSTLVNPAENNDMFLTHHDAMHPPSLNQATALPEDKLVPTLEDRLTCIWEEKQITNQKRRKQLVL